MHLVSLNVSLPRTISTRGQSVETGIFKTSVTGPQTVSNVNITGDAQADLTVHGGIDKAIYGYPVEHYPYWQDFLGRTDFSYGQFGENLTTEGLLEDAVHIGDQFRVGTVLLQVSQPRVPCFKLAIRMNEPRILKPFLNSGKVGFYFRVLETGVMQAGDRIELVASDPARMSIVEVLRLYFVDSDDVQGARRAADLPALASGWRTSFRERLAQQDLT